MSFRTVNGNARTEDGWRCCNRDECDIVRIPDLFLVDTAPIRRGPPLSILGAWLFWYDRNVEEITSSVWGWSETNDVLGRPGENNGSNHLSATAVDVNAPKYPWGQLRMSGDKIAKVEEGLRLFEGSVFWGRVWKDMGSKADEMHYQMAWPEGDSRNEAFAQKLLRGYLGIYGGQPPPPPPGEGYGMPAGSNSGGYGGSGVRFPDWVYQLGNAFGGLKPSTYPGHQETDRPDIGAAPNPNHLNRGIDWQGLPQNMLDFAHWLRDTGPRRTFGQYGPPGLEMVIYQDPRTGERVGYPAGVDYGDDYPNHTNHVHTRHSAALAPPGAPPPPPPPPTSNAVDVLAGATGISVARAVAILGQVSFALVKSNCTNPRRIAAALAQWVIESGHFVYTEEIASGPESQERWKYKGRTWIQLTWLENYKGFSEWGHSLGLVPTPDYFVVHPRELADQKWAALGPAYWWAIKYPQINEYADRGDIDNVSKWVNAPAWVDDPNKHANGEAQRRAAYNKALALGDQLLTLITGAPPPSPPPGEGFLMGLSDQEQRDFLNAFWLMYHTYMDNEESISPIRHVGEGKVLPLHRAIRNIDGSVHLLVEIMIGMMLRYPDPDAKALLNEVATVDTVAHPDRARDAKLAKAILAGLGTTAPTTTTTVYVPAPTPTLAPFAPTEVLPAVIPNPVAVEHTPQELLDTIDRLNVFDEEYNKRMFALRQGALTDDDEGEHSK